MRRGLCGASRRSVATNNGVFDSGAAAVANCTYPDNGSRMVKGKIMDKNGGARAYRVATVLSRISAVEGAESTAGQALPLGDVSDDSTGLSLDQRWQVIEGD